MISYGANVDQGEHDQGKTDLSGPFLWVRPAQWIELDYGGMRMLGMHVQCLAVSRQKLLRLMHFYPPSWNHLS